MWKFIVNTTQSNHVRHMRKHSQRPERRVQSQMAGGGTEEQPRPMGNMYESFLSHAGEQKWLCVDYIHDQLEAIKSATKTTDGRDLEVFFDDRSLLPGDEGWARIEEAAAGCRTGGCFEDETIATHRWPHD
jgi:hypothetical protein